MYKLLHPNQKSYYDMKKKTPGFCIYPTSIFRPATNFKNDDNLSDNRNIELNPKKIKINQPKEPGVVLQLENNKTQFPEAC